MFDRLRLARVGRFILRALVGTVALVVLLVALTLAVVNTPWGKDLLRDRVNAAAEGVHIGEIEGFLPWRMVLHDVRVTEQGDVRRMSAERLALRLRVLPLLARHVELPSLRLESADVEVVIVEEVTPAGEATAPTRDERRRDATPWTLAVRDLELSRSRVSLSQAGQLRAEATDVTMDGSVYVGEERTSVNIERLDGQLEALGVLWTVTLAGRAAVDATNIDLELRGAVSRAEQPPITLRADLHGPRRHAALDVVLASKTAGRVHAFGWLGLPAPQVDVAAALTVVFDELRPERAYPLLPALSVNGHVLLTGHGVPRAPTSAWRGALVITDGVIAGKAVDELVVTGETSGDTWRVDELTASALGVEVVGDAAGRGREFSAEVRAVGRGVVASGDVELTASKLRGLVTANAEVARGGRLRARVELAGTRDEPRASVAADLRGARIGRMRQVAARLRAVVAPEASRASAVLHGRGRRIAAASFRSPLGTTDLVSGVAWQSRPFTARVRVEDLRVRDLLPDAALLAGSLHGELRASGSLARPQAHAELALVDGKLGQRLDGPLAVVLEMKSEGAHTELEVRSTIAGAPLLDASARAEAPLARLLGGTAASAPISAELEASAVPLARFAEEERLGGTLNAVAQLERRGAGWRGTAEIAGYDLSVEGDPVGDLRISARLGPAQTTAHLLFEQPGERSFEARMTRTRDGHLRAELAARELDLSAVKELVPALRSVHPEISGSLALEVVRAPAHGDVPRHHEVVARVHGARFGLLLLPSPKEQDEEKPKPPVEPSEVTRLDERLRSLIPLRLHRLDIQESTVFLVDASEPLRPTLWITGLEASLENVATRRALLGGEPSVFAARGTAQRGGELTAFATLDPLSERPTLAGQAELRGVPLASLSRFLRAETGLVATQGELNAYAQFRVVNGKISGGVKPVIEAPELEAAPDTLFNAIKALLANVTIDLFQDEVPGREAIATIIPIKGDLESPDVQLVPTFLGIVRNAFVLAIASGLSSLPPPTAGEPQSLFEQAQQALREEAGPPKAQPERTRGG